MAAVRKFAAFILKARVLLVQQRRPVDSQEDSGDGHTEWGCQAWLQAPEPPRRTAKATLLCECAGHAWSCVPVSLCVRVCQP